MTNKELQTQIDKELKELEDPNGVTISRFDQTRVRPDAVNKHTTLCYIYLVLSELRRLEAVKTILKDTTDGAYPWDKEVVQQYIRELECDPWT